MWSTVYLCFVLSLLVPACSRIVGSQRSLSTVKRSSLLKRRYEDITPRTRNPVFALMETIDDKASSIGLPRGQVQALVSAGLTAVASKALETLFTQTMESISLPPHIQAAKLRYDLSKDEYTLLMQLWKPPSGGFTSIIGQLPAKRALLECLENPHIAKDNDPLKSPVTSLLLHGPSGGGKTSLISALGAAGRLPILTVPAHLINHPEQLRSVFALAEKMGKCAIFFDHLDEYLGSEKYGTWFKLELLNHWDTLSSHGSQVLILAATTNPSALPSTITSRFERSCTVTPTLSDEDTHALLSRVLQMSRVQGDVEGDDDWKECVRTLSTTYVNNQLGGSNDGDAEGSVGVTARDVLRMARWGIHEVGRERLRSTGNACGLLSGGGCGALTGKHHGNSTGSADSACGATEPAVLSVRPLTPADILAAADKV